MYIKRKNVVADNKRKMVMITRREYRHLPSGNLFQLTPLSPIISVLVELIESRDETIANI